MIDARARITDAAELPGGWFEQGSEPLSERALTAAFDFVGVLAGDGVLSKGATLDVIPTPMGGIQFEIAGEHGEIEVEIDASGDFHTLIELPDGSYRESARSAPLTVSTVLTQIARIL